MQGRPREPDVILQNKGLQERSIRGVAQQISQPNNKGKGKARAEGIPANGKQVTVILDDSENDGNPRDDHDSIQDSSDDDLDKANKRLQGGPLSAHKVCKTGHVQQQRQKYEGSTHHEEPPTVSKDESEDELKLTGANAARQTSFHAPSRLSIQTSRSLELKQSMFNGKIAEARRLVWTGDPLEPQCCWTVQGPGPKTLQDFRTSEIIFIEGPELSSPAAPDALPRGVEDTLFMMIQLKPDSKVCKDNGIQKAIDKRECTRVMCLVHHSTWLIN